MSIINPSRITPRKFRGITPECYRNREYIKLITGATVTIESVVFSVYQPRDKNGNGPMVFDDGTPIKNITCYIGMTDGTYTSVKNEIVECQLSALVGFDIDKAEIGQKYPYKVEPNETVKVVEIKRDGYSYPLVAFEN